MRGKFKTRLDLVASTRHDEFVQLDYQRLRSIGIGAAREGTRWHLIEEKPGFYDFSSVRRMMDAADETGVELVWDMLHYGWPDGLNPMKKEFIDRFARYCEAFARLYKARYTTPLLACPVNEISFLAWAGGEIGYINPYEKHQGDTLKFNLVRAAIAGADALLNVIPETRLIQIDPLIHIWPNKALPSRTDYIQGYNEAQFAAFDMICGRLHPELGGHPRYLDIVGINYYPRNQWIDHGEVINPGSTRYIDFRDLVRKIHDRYGRPILLAETGTEDDERAEWFHYIGREVLACRREGLPLEGVCLYPILNHPGWDDNRHCCNGIWDYADDTGHRPVHAPLAEEVRAFNVLFEKLVDFNRRQQTKPPAEVSAVRDTGWLADA